MISGREAILEDKMCPHEPSQRQRGRKLTATFKEGNCGGHAEFVYLKTNTTKKWNTPRGSMRIMAKKEKMAVIAVMEYYELALNMVFMGVFLKNSKNPDQT